MNTFGRTLTLTKPTIVAAAMCEDLRPAPINPLWIRSGNPHARNAVLSRSDDGLAFTMFWDCTAGEFDWHYSFDETIHFIEGSVIISDGNGPPRRFIAGDVLFLPRGVIARWQVESYVRKVAFCHYPAPRFVGICIRAIRKLKHISTRTAGSGVLYVAFDAIRAT